MTSNQIKELYLLWIRVDEEVATYFRRYLALQEGVYLMDTVISPY